MNNDWTTQRGQLDQALELERALRQARRRQQPSFTQALKAHWQAMVAAFHRQRHLSASDCGPSTPLHRWTTQ